MERCVTTNYDTLLERAADTVTSRRYHVVVSQEDLVNSNDVPRIINCMVHFLLIALLLLQRKIIGHIPYNLLR